MGLRVRLLLLASIQVIRWTMQVRKAVGTEYKKNASLR